MGDGVEVEGKPGGGRLVQENRFRAGEDRGALVDLVERVRRRHQRRPTRRVNDGLGKGEQRFARAIDRKHLGLRVEMRQPVAPLKPRRHSIAQGVKSRRRRIHRQTVQMRHQRVADQRWRRMPRFTNRQLNSCRRRWNKAGNERS